MKQVLDKPCYTSNSEKIIATAEPPLASSHCCHECAKLFWSPTTELKISLPIGCCYWLREAFFARLKLALILWSRWESHCLTKRLMVAGIIHRGANRNWSQSQGSRIVGKTEALESESGV